MKKIIVTGGMGYIGSHTIIELIRDGRFEPISIDSCINSSVETIQHIYRATGQVIVNHQIDICDFDALDSIMSTLGQIDGIIHFAALKSVPDSVENPLLYYRNNINSLGNILELSKKYDISNIIFSSSCSIYGNVTELPVNEATPFGKAESPYAYTKQIGEVLIQDMTKVWTDLRAISLRYFNPVGADKTGLNGENPINPPTALVPYITQTAAGIFPKLSVFGTDYNTRDGSCIRDYIHVSDLAEAHILAMNYLFEGKQSVGFDTFNIGSGEGVTVLEAVNAFQDVSGIDLPHVMEKRRAGDVEAIYSDSSKIHQKMGWVPKRGIAEMMKSAWVWQQHLSGIKLG